MESTCERGLYTLQDFSDMMCEIFQTQGDENVYSVKHIKRQLENNMENICSLLKFWDAKMCVFRDFCNHLVTLLEVFRTLTEKSSGSVLAGTCFR